MDPPDEKNDMWTAEVYFGLNGVFCTIKKNSTTCCSSNISAFGARLVSILMLNLLFGLPGC